MDAKKVVRNSLQKGGGLLIAAIVCLAVCLACVAAVLLNSRTGKGAAALDPTKESVGDYGSIEFNLMSDAVASDDTLDYFLVLTTDKHYYIVADKAADFETKYADILAWSFAKEGEGTEPAPMILNGTLQTASSDLLSYVGESMDWSTDEVVNYCGSYYLDATMSPASQNRGIFTIVAFFAGLLALGFGIPSLTRASAAAKTIRRLTDDGELDRVAEQLTSPTSQVLEGGSAIFTQDYLVAPRAGRIVRYADILWCYLTVQRTNFIATAQYLTLRTSRRESIGIANDKPGSKSRGIAQWAMQEIARRNPSVLLGHTAANIQEYSSRLQNGYVPAPAAAAAASQPQTPYNPNPYQQYPGQPVYQAPGAAAQAAVTPARPYAQASAAVSQPQTPYNPNPYQQYAGQPVYQAPGAAAQAAVTPAQSNTQEPAAVQPNATPAQPAVPQSAQEADDSGYLGNIGSSGRNGES